VYLSKKLLFFVSRRPATQVIDTAVIAVRPGLAFGAFPSSCQSREAYTSYMCNLYAIFAIHCIGNFSAVHFETGWDFVCQGELLLATSDPNYQPVWF
jgi:hypothetical protein